MDVDRNYISIRERYDSSKHATARILGHQAITTPDAGINVTVFSK